MAENYPRQNSPDDHFIKVLTQTEVDLGGFIMDQEMDPNLFSPDNANWAPMDDMQQQQQHNFPQVGIYSRLRLIESPWLALLSEVNCK